MPEHPRERFQELLESFTNGMLVTQAENGAMTGRPMQVAQVDEDGGLWFVTHAGSAKVDDISGDRRVLVTFQDSGRFLTVNGTASLSDERRRISAMWKESWRVWFPEGPEDQSLVLLHVEATDGQFWDRGGLLGLTYAIRAGQAYWLGETPDLPEDMNAKVSLG